MDKFTRFASSGATDVLPGGRRAEAFWSRTAAVAYSRASVKAPARYYQLFERDMYIFGDESAAFFVFALDNGLFGAVSATVMPVRSEPLEKTVTKKIAFPLGRLGLPESGAFGDMIYRSRGASMDYLRAPDARYVRVYMDKFDDVRSLYINVALKETCEDQPQFIRTAGGGKESFSCRHFIPALAPSGKIVSGAEVFELSGDRSAGLLVRERFLRYREKAPRLFACGMCGGERFAVGLSSESGSFYTVGGASAAIEAFSLDQNDGGMIARSANNRLTLQLSALCLRCDSISHLFFDRFPRDAQRRGLSGAQRLSGCLRRCFGRCSGTLTVGNEQRAIDYGFCVIEGDM